MLEQYKRGREDGRHYKPWFWEQQGKSDWREFYNDLEAHDVFKLCWSDMTEIAMIHGDADETASVVDARRFEKQFGAKLTEVKGADHRIMIPGRDGAGNRRRGEVFQLKVISTRRWA